MLYSLSIIEIILRGLGVLLAIFIGIMASHWIISYLVNTLYDIDKLGSKGKLDFQARPRDKYARIQSAILGFIERALYIIAFLFQQYGFVGLWITIITASKWSSWKEKEGRRKFNNFLIGNGLNLLFSFCSYLLIRLSIDIYANDIFLWYPVVLVIPFVISCPLICCINRNKKAIKDDFFYQSLLDKSFHNINKLPKESS